MRRRLWVHMLLLAALLLVLNDHFLKGGGLLPGAITGKLSDICGLFVLPIVLARLARPMLGDSKRVHAAICAGSALAFALVKTTSPMNALYGAILGPTLVDPTDLIALPAAFVAFAALRAPRAPRSWRDRISLVVAALGCMATSAPRPPNDPSRQPPPPVAVAQAPACAAVTATGIEPRGDDAAVHFTVKNTSTTDCDVTLAVRLDAKTQTQGTEVSVSGSKGPLTIPAGASTDVAVPVRGPYPITCNGEGLLDWDVSESSIQGDYKSPGGGRIGCWQSTVLSP